MIIRMLFKMHCIVPLIAQEKIVQMYDLLLKGDDPEDAAQNDRFWPEFFLLRPKIAVFEAELAKLNVDQLQRARPNLNRLFERCTANLGEDHPIRCVYALQTLCGLVRAGFKKSGQAGFDLINLIMGFDVAELRMQKLMKHLNEYE